MSDGNDISRRDAIKGTAAGFFGLGTPEFTLAERKRRLVVARNGEGPVEVERVSKRWLNHRNQAHAIKDDLLRSYWKRGVNSVVGGEVTDSETVVGSRRGLKIRLYLEREGVGVSVPSSVEGIPVETVVDSGGQRLACKNDGPYSILKGGVKSSQYSDGFPYATTGAMVDDGGYKYLLTCWHMFDDDESDNSCDTIWGDPFYHQGTEFGTVSDFASANDWALVDVPTSDMTDGILTSHDSTVHPIGAWFTSSGIDSAMTNDRKMYQQGVSTGYTEGLVESNGVTKSGPEGCIDLSDGVKFNVDAAGGDSGGPVFAWGKNDPDNAVFAGWVSWGDSDYVNGTVTICDGHDTYLYTQFYSPLFDYLYNNYGIELVTV